MDEVISYLKIPQRLPSGRGLWLLHGRRVPDAYAGIGENAHRPAIIDGGITPYHLPSTCESCCLAGCAVLQNGGEQPKKFWKRPFRRNGLPPQGTTPKRSTMPWKPISKPFPIGRSAIYSGPPTTTRFRSAPQKSARRSPTGTAMTKRGSQADIQFIKRYFPKARIHGIPKMAHAELVMVHPEKFCRYAEKFLIMQAEESMI